MPKPPEPDFQFNVDVYQQSIQVFTRRRPVRRWLRSNGVARGTPRDAYATSWTATTPSGHRRFVLYIPKDATPLAVAHEAVHLAWYMLKGAGVWVDAENHEALAYLVGFISEQVTAGLSRLRN